MFKLLLLSLIIFFSGCSVKEPPAIVEAVFKPLNNLLPKREVKPVDLGVIDDNTSSLSIIRNYNYVGSLGHMYPILNGKKLAGLKSYEYIKVNVPSGKQKLGLKLWNVFGWSNVDTEYNFIKNKNYYFLISPTILCIYKCFEIEEISEEEFTQRASESEEIPLFSVSESLF